MISRILLSSLAAFSAGLMLVACTADSMMRTQDASPGAVEVMEAILDYALLSRGEMIAAADAILVVKITSISATSWNQDSGEYWEQEFEGSSVTATPLHYLEVAVLQPIVDELGLGGTAVLTIAGKSPADGGRLPITAWLQLGGTADYDLQVGDQVVLFAKEIDIGWWSEEEPMRYDGTRGAFEGARRRVLTFANSPSASYLLLGEDGLYHPQAPASELEDGPISLETLLEEIALHRLD